MFEVKIPAMFLPNFDSFLVNFQRLTNIIQMYSKFDTSMLCLLSLLPECDYLFHSKAHLKYPRSASKRSALGIHIRWSIKNTTETFLGTLTIYSILTQNLSIGMSDQSPVTPETKQWHVSQRSWCVKRYFEFRS